MEASALPMTAGSGHAGGRPTLLVVLSSIFLAAAAPAADEVKALPGWDAPLPSKHYSGFVNVTDTAGIPMLVHYLYIESEKAPDADPTILCACSRPRSIRFNSRHILAPCCTYVLRCVCPCACRVQWRPGSLVHVWHLCRAGAAGAERGLALDGRIQEDGRADALSQRVRLVEARLGPHV